MKPGRLAAYAIGGIIVGLLLENNTLRLREKAGEKARAIKKKATEKYKAVVHN
jgi:hypothetical protein